MNLLSSYSDKELADIAGIKLPAKTAPDMSIYSDEELMRIAGIAQPAPERPSIALEPPTQELAPSGEAQASGLPEAIEPPVAIDPIDAKIDEVTERVAKKQPMWAGISFPELPEMAVAQPATTAVPETVEPSPQGPPPLDLSRISEPGFLEKAKVRMERGRKGADLDIASFNAALGFENWDDVKKRRDDFMQKELKQPVEEGGWLSRAAMGAAEMAPPMVKGSMEGALVAGGTAALTALAVGQVPPLTAIPEEVVTVPLAYAVGAGQFWYRQGTGAMYANLREAGVSHNIAGPISMGMGVPYALIEMLQVRRIIPFAGPLLNKTFQQSTSRIIVNALTRYGVNVLKETGEETLQEIVQIAAEEGGKAVENALHESGIEQTEAGEALVRTWDATKQSIGPLSLLLLPTSVSGTAGRIDAARQLKKEVDSLTDEQKTRLGIDDEIVDKIVETGEQPEPIAKPVPKAELPVVPKPTPEPAKAPEVVPEPSVEAEKPTKPVPEVVPEKPVEKPVKPKEAWEMTRGEWSEAYEARPRTDYAEQDIRVAKARDITIKGVREIERLLYGIKDFDIIDGEQFRKTHFEIHQQIIDKALTEGKPVPPEVLKDYPDLAKKYGKVEEKVEAKRVVSEKMERVRKKIEKHAQTNLEKAGEADAIWFQSTENKDERIVVSRDTKEKGKWRATIFEKLGKETGAAKIPTGHYLFDSREDAIRSLSGQSTGKTKEPPIGSRDEYVFVEAKGFPEKPSFPEQEKPTIQAKPEAPVEKAEVAPEKPIAPSENLERAQKYVKSLKNKQKKSYAKDYLGWLTGKTEKEPDWRNYTIQFMTGQAVRSEFELTFGTGMLQGDKLRSSIVGEEKVEVTPEKPEIAPKEIGKKKKARTEAGTEIEFDYVVNEASDYIASHDTDLVPNKNYPAEKQPRDRSKIASEVQIRKIETDLIPERLGENVMASEGAPIVDDTGNVEAGNARMIALQRVYKSGKEGAARYKQWLIDNADKFGLDPDTIKGMKSPILTRRRLTDVDVKKFVEEANIQATAAMSGAEQAKIDADKLDTSVLEQFVPNDKGEINTAANAEFVKSFFGKAIGETEIGRYVDKKGFITQEGISRVRNAVFAKAFGETSAIERLAESTDSNIKNITNAMLAVSPKIAMLRSQIDKGTRYDFDMSNDIVQAADKLSNLREEGEKLDTYLKQQGLFPETDITPLAKDVLRVFDTHKRSSRRLAQIFNEYLNIVEGYGNPKQEGFFEGDGKPTKAELLIVAEETTEEGHGQEDLFKYQIRRGEPGEAAVEKGVVKTEKVAEILRAKEKEVAKALNIKVPEGTYEQVGVPDSEDSRMAVEIGHIFGDDVYFIKSNLPEADVFTGTTYHKEGTILLNARTRVGESHTLTLGHELVHRLRAEEPDLYRKLRHGLLWDDPALVETYHKRLSFARHKHFDTLSEVLKMEEVVADTVGERMSEPGFWKKLYERSPELVKKIMQYINKVLRRLRINKEYRTSQYFKDIQKVHDVVDDVMTEYAGRIAKRGRRPVTGVGVTKAQIRILGEEETPKRRKIKTKKPTGIPSTETLLKDMPDARNDRGADISLLLDRWHSNKDERIQRAKSETARLQDEIKKTTGSNKFGDDEKKIDMAIQLKIDLLGKQAAQIKKYTDKLSPEQRDILELSQELSKEQIKIAHDIIESNKRMGMEAAHVNVIRNVLDNYTMRLWQQEPSEKQEASLRRKFGTTTARAKHRTLESILHGWSLGKELRIKGATTALSAMQEEVAKTIEDKALMAMAEKSGLIGKKQLEGWKRVEHPNFTRWKWAGRVEEGKVYGRNFFADKDGNLYERINMYAEPELAKRLNNILGTSRLYDVWGIKELTRFNSELKHTILTLSLFHHQAFLRSYLFGARIGIRDINPIRAGKKGLEAVKKFTPEVKELVRGGLTIGRVQDFDEKGWNDAEETRIGKIIDSIPGGKGAKGAILNFRDKQTDFLFNKMGPGLKVQSALLEYRYLLKKHDQQLRSGEMERHEVAKMVANLINDDFGGLHLARMERNPTQQHIFRLAGLAPDWTESNIRTMVRAFKSGKEGQIYRDFWVRVGYKSALGTILFNLLMSAFDDESFWERYKKAWKTGYFRWLEVDITPLYKALGGQSESRKYFSLIGHFKDPLKFVTRPLRSAKHKGSVITRFILEAIVGQNWAGRRFTTIHELLGIDDKGRYKTSRRGEYKKGDPKGGKLKGKLIQHYRGPSGVIEYSQIPSYLLHQARSSMPIPIQSGLAFLAGEYDAFDAIGKALGFAVSRSYRQPEEESKSTKRKVIKRKLRPVKRRVIKK